MPAWAKSRRASSSVRENGAPFSRTELEALLDLAQAGIEELSALQRKALT